MSCDYLADQFKIFVDSVPEETPLLAVIAFHEAHMPVVADPQKRLACETSDSVCRSNILKMLPNSAASNYFGVVSSLDDAVGKIYRALKDADRLADTFLIFTSDNGPEEHTRGGSGSALPFSGTKRMLLEGGHRVPGILHWPAKIRKNHRLSTLVSALDIRPTIQHILHTENEQLDVQQSDDMDGVSWLPMMMLAEPNYWTRQTPLGMCLPLKSTDAVATVCNTIAYYQGNMKLILSIAPSLNQPNERLFNIETDLAELRDISTENRALVSELNIKAKALRSKIIKDFNMNCPYVKKG